MNGAPRKHPPWSPGADHERSMNTERKRKKFLGILFECCNVYRRIYLNRQETAYEGRCPRCYREVKVLIGPEGTDQRFFRAH